MVFALVFIAIPFAAVGMAWWLAPKHGQEKDDVDMAVLVALHGIRRRTEVFMFRVEVERYAQHVEGQLRKELRELRQREQQLNERGS